VRRWAGALGDRHPGRLRRGQSHDRCNGLILGGSAPLGCNEFRRGARDGRNHEYPDGLGNVRQYCGHEQCFLHCSVHHHDGNRKQHPDHVVGLDHDGTRRVE